VSAKKIYLCCYVLFFAIVGCRQEEKKELNLDTLIHRYAQHLQKELTTEIEIDKIDIHVEPDLSFNALLALFPTLDTTIIFSIDTSFGNMQIFENNSFWNGLRVNKSPELPAALILQWLNDTSSIAAVKESTSGTNAFSKFVQEYLLDTAYTWHMLHPILRVNSNKNILLLIAGRHQYSSTNGAYVQLWWCRFDQDQNWVSCIDVGKQEYHRTLRDTDEREYFYYDSEFNRLEISIIKEMWSSKQFGWKEMMTENGVDSIAFPTIIRSGMF
jgi:hypothetical protein